MSATTTLSDLARAAWIAWGDGWAKHTVCKGCGEFLYCRSHRGPEGPWLCLDCFDQR